ncbi:MAG TPA: TolC family protein [Thermoanaerobaculia bacterium]|nr:TolC family protein [Thermoanaerobaculia bacterium]
MYEQRERFSKALAACCVLATLAGVASAREPLPEPQRPRTLVISLDEALRIAAGESETVWAAEAGVLQAVGSRRIARSAWFPQVSADASYVRTLRSQFQDLDFGGLGGGEPGEEPAIDLPFGRENQYSLGLSLSQLVFDGGQTAARNRAAAARLRSAELDVTSAAAQTLLDVTQAYFDAQLADRLVQIAEASLEQSEETLRQTEVARRVGDKSEYELLRARVARDNQIPTVVRQRLQSTESYLRLKQLLNVPPGDQLVLTTGVEEEVPRFATAADVSPDERAPVVQARENVEANEAQLSEARGQRLPAVSLSSRFAPVAYPASGLPEPDDFREDWSVTLSLSVPLLTWGRLRGNEEVARGGLSQAQARLAQVREAAVLDATIARDDLARARAVLAGNTSTVQEAERAFGIARIRFREGIATQIELDDARLLFEQAQVNRAIALRDVQAARARLALLADLPLSQGSGAPQLIQIQQQPVTQPSPSQPFATAATGSAVGIVPGTGGSFP